MKGIKKSTSLYFLIHEGENIKVSLIYGVVLLQVECGKHFSTIERIH